MAAVGYAAAAAVAADAAVGAPSVIPFPISTFAPITPSHTNLLTVAVLTSLYGLMTIIIAFQLGLIFYYRHSKKSFQIFFLALSFVWALFRTILFGVKIATQWPVIVYRLFYVVPVCAQFGSVSLLVLYYATQILRKTPQALASDLISTHNSTRRRRQMYFVLTLVANVVFVSVNLAFTAFDRYASRITHAHIVIRVIVTEGFFVVLTFIFALLVYRILRMRTAGHLLEAREWTVWQVLVIAGIMVIVFLSRAIYNFVVLAQSDVQPWGYWPANDDHAASQSYLALFGSLFAWEILPTSITVYFFRVKRPKATEYGPLQRRMTADPDDGGTHHVPKLSFFNNPHRYDSDEDESCDAVPSLNADSYTSSLPYNIYAADTPSNYGSIARSYSFGSSRFGGSYAPVTYNNSAGSQSHYGSTASSSGGARQTTPPR